MLTIGSLFAGIGGLELGLESAGLGPVVWQCEIDPFCRAVLAKHWPNVTRFEDVTRPRDWPHVDLVCGGFPCQDVSSAGKRRGIGGQRSGLWHHFARVVRAVRPRWVVVENVASGATKWLRPVRHQLHLFGYRTRALGITASDCGAPHRRARVFVIAYVDRQGESAVAEHAKMAGASAAADAVGDDVRLEQGRGGGAGGGDEAIAGRAGDASPDADGARRGRLTAGRWGAPVPDVLRVADGVSRGLHGPQNRIRALGNAVVPQVAQVVGEVIRQMLAGGTPHA